MNFSIRNLQRDVLALSRQPCLLQSSLRLQGAHFVLFSPPALTEASGARCCAVGVLRICIRTQFPNLRATLRILTGD